MSITYHEKDQFSKKSGDIAERLIAKFGDNGDSVLLFKVIAHSLRNNESLIRQFDESIFENQEVFKNKFSVLLNHALSEAWNQTATSITIAEEGKPNTSSQSLDGYTPSQLSKYFGVSVVTIHNWLDQDRFLGIKRAGNHRHNRIPEDTLFITATGKKVLVKHIVDMWDKENAESIPSDESELAFLTRQIALYETKYNGEFERTLGSKSERTPEEETDAEIWRHLLGRQRLEFGDT